MSDVPQDFHQLNYARRILDDLGLPAKGNLELVADCIEAVAKSKRIPLHESYSWLWERCERAARHSTAITRWWFQNGDYLRADDPEPVFKGNYQKIDHAKTEREQMTPEWQRSSEKARQVWAQIAEGKYERPRNSKEKIRQQAAEIMAKRGQ